MVAVVRRGSWGPFAISLSGRGFGSLESSLAIPVSFGNSAPHRLSPVHSPETRTRLGPAVLRQARLVPTILAADCPTVRNVPMSSQSLFVNGRPFGLRDFGHFFFPAGERRSI